jgi:hypothetical protein
MTLFGIVLISVAAVSTAGGKGGKTAALAAKLSRSETAQRILFRFVHIEYSV